MSDAIWQAECINKFNALPRKPLAPGPSGLVPNVWHFDLRYIPISPPSHILFLLQNESKIAAHQILPVGKDQNASGLSYFPYNAKDAALEICFGLMHLFNTVLNQEKSPIGSVPMAPYGPWKLTTDDCSLAEAVETQFKALGVEGERCKVDFVDLTEEAQKHFEAMYDGIANAHGLAGLARALLVTPDSIAFSSRPQPGPKGGALMPRSPEDADSDTHQLLMYYAYEYMNSEPYPMASSPSDKIRRPYSFEDLLIMIKYRTTFMTLEQVKREADIGDGVAAIDAGLRLKYGIQCETDRFLSRSYLLKAALDEKVSAETRSMAHSLLVFWYTAGRTSDVDSRDISAAIYHADEAVRIASQNDHGSHRLVATANVILFARTTVEPLINRLKVPELLIHFKWIVKALKQRNATTRLERLAVERKMMKKPNRYRCANVDCEIEADTGKMLYQCSGKCDRDKKPSYCGKRCREHSIFNPHSRLPRTDRNISYISEKEDWKNHKPFCQPGAPCSVIEPITYSTSGAGSTPGGSIRVPVHHNNGTTTLYSTSTMDPELLKEMGKNINMEKTALGENRSVKLDLFNIDSSSSCNNDSMLVIRL
ncbi:hypothetical protein F5880DRAFT_1754890 [Lentinula raphanica]|nr:hypothetical protein F5880DRAFT_1754890 [Lentinula raphanica]